MGYINVGTENESEIKIHFTDHGKGETIVMIHGYPFSGMAWERQEAYLLENGYRVITYDRRGFGKSSQPSKGYNYDTFAADLDTLLSTLDLYGVTLVGHSMGTGEIARYLSKFGSSRIDRAVMISPIPPYLLKTEDNPTGVDQKVFDGIKEAIENDRYAYMSEFLNNFYSGSFLGEKVSEEKLRADFNMGVSSSPIAFLKCVDTWLEDFRPDVDKIDVPLLVIQGDADKILPLESTGKVLVKKVGELLSIDGGSHGIPWTHAREINEAILSFIQKNPAVRRGKPEISLDQSQIQ